MAGWPLTSRLVIVFRDNNGCLLPLVDCLVMMMMVKMVITMAKLMTIVTMKVVELLDELMTIVTMKVVELLDELASDPDDKHVPPSVRNSYRCEKVVYLICLIP